MFAVIVFSLAAIISGSLMEISLLMGMVDGMTLIRGGARLPLWANPVTYIGVVAVVGGVVGLLYAVFELVRAVRNGSSPEAADLQ